MTTNNLEAREPFDTSAGARDKALAECAAIADKQHEHDGWHGSKAIAAAIRALQRSAPPAALERERNARWEGMESAARIADGFAPDSETAGVIAETIRGAIAFAKSHKATPPAASVPGRERKEQPDE